MSGPGLIVGLDHVATVRQAGSGADPDPVAAATLALLAGADGVSIHLREDRIGVQDRDARVLRQTVRSGFHMFVAPLPEMMKVALEVRPDAVTLVPEQPEELDLTGGLDVPTELASLGETVRALRDGNVECSLLVTPDVDQIRAVHRIGAHGVQVQTSRFAEGGPDCGDELERIHDAVRLSSKLGLAVSLGGGLDYRNLGPLLALDGLHQLRIGHSIIARALLLGLDRAVRELKSLLA